MSFNNLVNYYNIKQYQLYTFSNFLYTKSKIIKTGERNNIVKNKIITYNNLFLCYIYTNKLIVIIAKRGKREKKRKGR